MKVMNRSTGESDWHLRYLGLSMAILDAAASFLEMARAFLVHPLMFLAGNYYYRINAAPPGSADTLLRRVTRGNPSKLE